MDLLKKPSAWIPIVLSLIMVVSLIAIINFSDPIVSVPGVRPDEGTAAHIFQIWLVIEVLMIAFFALKYLFEKPTAAFMILAIQIIGVLLVCAPVFLLHL